MNKEQNTLHDLAVEFTFEAERAQKRGDIVQAKKFFEKAFQLEKEFALVIPKGNPELQLTRTIIFRSAAWLALESGNLDEAKTLVNQILNENPHPSVIEELKGILKEIINRTPSKEVQKLDITGTLVSADIPYNQIKIQEEKSKKFFAVIVPANEIVEIAKSFLAEKVLINGQSKSDGLILLQKIKKVA